MRAHIPIEKKKKMHAHTFFALLSVLIGVEEWFLISCIGFNIFSDWFQFSGCTALLEKWAVQFLF